jgi:hypothetical protein
MTFKIVVRSAPTKRSSSSLRSSQLAISLILAVSLAFLYREPAFSLKFLLWSLISLFFISYVVFWNGTSSQKSVSVTILPLGVQLETNSSASCDPIFLPRQSILDCIVHEIILGHCVISVVLLRVQTETAYRLVQVFPGVELTYNECLALRGQIQTCLNKSTT